MKELNQSASMAASDVRPPSTRYFQRGLYAVAGQRIKGQQATRILTTQEVIQVNRVTVRESFTHRFWPPEVLEGFLTADVIKNQ